MRKIFHLEMKSDKSHRYYGDLSVMFKENNNLGVSKFTLDRFNFDAGYYENETCIIRKSSIVTSKRQAKIITK